MWTSSFQIMTHFLSGAWLHTMKAVFTMIRRFTHRFTAAGLADRITLF